MICSFTVIFTNISFNPIHSLWLCVGVCVCVSTGMCSSLRAFVSACMILCAIMAHPCGYHFYALAQKVLPDHAITTSPPGCVGVCGGGSAARGDECEGMECLCTLCIWTACPFSNNFTQQKLKLRGNMASKVIIIICGTEKSEFLFTLEPSCLSWVSISKQRRWHWREVLEDRTQLDRGCNCRHVAPFRWRGEEVKPGHLKEWWGWRGVAVSVHSWFEGWEGEEGDGRRSEEINRAVEL